MALRLRCEPAVFLCRAYGTHLIFSTLPNTSVLGYIYSARSAGWILSSPGRFSIGAIEAG